MRYEAAQRFYGSNAPGRVLPLARYLPPLPQGMVQDWLAEHVPAGGWVLDPLGATPALALEAARAGYRVIVACNNPIVSFLVEMLGEARSPAEYQSALAELALTKRGEERLEPHIQALYRTTCPKCEAVIEAEAFLWRKNEAQPYARLAKCMGCGIEEEQPVTEDDLEKLKLPGSDALHRSRALQRVVMSEDEYREDVEQALATYLPRPLYVLFTLINKLEGLALPAERERMLQALLISAFDAGNTLWAWPNARSRPRQLLIPPAFRENNLWSVLEGAVSEWAGHAPGEAVTVTRWPKLPPASGGICLYRGRIKSLVPLPEEMGPQAIVTVFPRPNQAFWTLSALWSGWLWGREAALPLRNVLDRRRYDWNWHTSALHSALAAVSKQVPAGTPFFGIAPELAPGFLAAVVTACEAAGFHLEGLAMRGDGNLAQGAWRPAAVGNETNDSTTLEQIARSAMQEELLARNEPAAYLNIYAAGLGGLARATAIPDSPQGITGDLFTRLQTALTRPFADRGFLRRYETNEDAPSNDEERGWWWLAQSGLARNGETAGQLALSDRVEMEIVRYLQKRPTAQLAEIEQALFTQFTGLQTPAAELVRACLESYAEETHEGAWRLRVEETSAARRGDLQEMRSLLTDLGERLGCRVQQSGETTISWESGSVLPRWVFSLMASSVISRYVLASPTPEENSGETRRVLVLPDSRLALLAWKLRRNARLTEAAKGWRLLKFQQVRDIAGREVMDWESWEKDIIPL